MTIVSLPNGSHPQVWQSQLPWSSGEPENQRFNRFTSIALAVTLALAVAVKWQDLPEQPRAEREKLPPQLAKIIQAKAPPPAPKIEPKPVPKPEPKPVVKEAPKPEVKPEAKPKPAVKPEPQPVVVPPPPPEPTQAEKVAQARENAKQSGLLAFQDDLASMREGLSLNNLANTQTVEGAGKAEQTQRKLIGKKVASTSGGVNLGAATTDIGARGTLDERKTTEFAAPEKGVASLAAKRIEEEQQVIGDRDIESIRRVLDANKGAVYALYRRALRQDPSLEGKVTVKLVIEPDGSLSLVSLIDSELEAPELERKLLSRIRLINFGPDTVTQTELEYAFNFLPY